MRELITRLQDGESKLQNKSNEMQLGSEIKISSDKTEPIFNHQLIIN